MVFDPLDGSSNIAASIPTGMCACVRTQPSAQSVVLTASVICLKSCAAYHVAGRTFRRSARWRNTSALSSLVCVRVYAFVTASSGSIFGVYERTADGSAESDVLQSGRQQVAAGYTLYSSATM